MEDLAEIRKQGEIAAIKKYINKEQYHLTNRIWSDIEDLNKYYRLGEAITNAEALLQNMREALAELQKLDPEQK